MGKEKKARKPINKKKLIANIIIIFLVLAMVLSVAASLIYYLLAS